MQIIEGTVNAMRCRGPRTHDADERDAKAQHQLLSRTHVSFEQRQGMETTAPSFGTTKSVNHIEYQIKSEFVFCQTKQERVPQACNMSAIAPQLPKQLKRNHCQDRPPMICGVSSDPVRP